MILEAIPSSEKETNPWVSAEARFDESGFRSRLGQFAFGFALESPPAACLTGATR